MSRSIAPAAAAPPRLFSLAWPLFVEMLLGIGVGVAGTALAARLSDQHGAAFALANHVVATVFVLFRVVGAGVGVVVTQALGAGRRDSADALARAAVGASTWVGGGIALAVLLGAAPLLKLLNAPPDLYPLAVPLLQVLAPALLLDAWNASMASVMRSHLRTRDTLAVMVVMQLVQLALAVPLMLGLGAWAGLGLVGYALALVASRLLALALHLGLFRQRLSLTLRAHHWWHLPRAELGAMAHIGLPGAAENIAWRMAFTASVAAVGLLGVQAVATHAYVFQLMHLIMLFSVATGLGVEIVVGHLIGAGALRQAHALVRRALARGIAVALGTALVFALAGPWLLRLFTQDEQIIHQGTLLLWCCLLLEPGRTFNLVVINALRAAGDARYPVMAGAASMLVVLAGGSWLLGVKLGLGLLGVWLAYAADEWLRGLLMWRRWARLAWVPHARRSRRRLAAA